MSHQRVIVLPLAVALTLTGVPSAQPAVAREVVKAHQSVHKDFAPGGLFPADPTVAKSPFVLEHTHVNARLAGNLARVEVKQRFRNPYKSPLEAVYVFPLPDEAAVDEMEMRVGGKVIKGLIKRREEAKKIYEDAKRHGQTAGLLDQERDNIFTQAVANIKPGEAVEVTIRYSESMQFEGGDYEFVFPMVVGPRYMPKSGVADANRISPPVMRPGTRSGHDIQVTVEVEGTLTGNIVSPSHGIEVRDGGRGKLVKLAQGDRIPNKDLILRYRVAGNATRTEVLTESDARGGHFGLYLTPALNVPARAVQPKDVVFLMDTSGSQSGEPIVQSQALMRRFLAGLNPADTFTIIDFANVATRLSDEPLANTAANRKMALKYVDALTANGGTELKNGIDAVLKFPPAPKGRLRSVVLLTDGYVGNDVEVIAEVQKRLPHGVRLYSFGVGNAVNRFILDRLAEVGRGTMHVVRTDEELAPVCEKFFKQINDPVLTNIKVTWEGKGPAPTLFPQPAPDLFANQPLVVFGRKGDRQSGTLLVEGTVAGGSAFAQRVPVKFDQDGHPAIATLWARARLKQLQNNMFGGETKEGVAEATETALGYHLMSPYTSFVAVSEATRVDPNGKRIKVDVPVALPEGVRFDGVFGKDKEEMKMNSRAYNAPTGAAPPAHVTYAPKPLPHPVQAPSRIGVVSATGLDAAARGDLANALNTLTLAAGVKGRVTFHLTIAQGKVTAVTPDAKASTLTDAAALAALEKAILAWAAPGNAAANVTVVVEVQP